MATVKKTTQDETSQVSRIRITLTSRNAKNIEKASTDLLSRAKEHDVKVRGPVRLPTRTLKHTTRKTPCGNGTNTWDTYELNIYKRVIDLHASKEAAQKVTDIDIAAGVDVDVTVHA